MVRVLEKLKFIFSENNKTSIFPNFLAHLHKPLHRHTHVAHSAQQCKHASRMHAAGNTRRNSALCAAQEADLSIGKVGALFFKNLPCPCGETAVYRFSAPSFRFFQNLYIQRPRNLTEENSPSLSAYLSERS